MGLSASLTAPPSPGPSPGPSSSTGLAHTEAYTQAQTGLLCDWEAPVVMKGPGGERPLGWTSRPGGGQDHGPESQASPAR